MKKLLLLLLVPVLSGQLLAQTGTWKTIDDNTGEAKSHVELYEKNGQLMGKVVKLLKESPDRTCDKCPGTRKDQPVLNMIILENMQRKDGYWQSGRILDPEKGKWYSCTMWLKDGDPDVLVVRGYLGFFYRTQHWYRVK
jgi:uncharacterized protein (DUF2147 family)